MKKFFIILSIIIFASSCAYAKEDKNKFEGMGYKGKLPDLTQKLIPSEPTSTKPNFEQVQDFYSENQIKPIPRENPTFVNIMLKQDKTSQYLNDINEFIPMLEKLYDSIENQENIQLFNAKVYFFNKNAEYLRSKYIEKPESEYISFKKILKLSSQAKTIALLRSEALKYNPYLAYGGSGQIYDPNNINAQIDYLKSEIHQTILLLKDAD